MKKYITCNYAEEKLSSIQNLLKAVFPETDAKKYFARISTAVNLKHQGRLHAVRSALHLSEVGFTMHALLAKSKSPKAASVQKELDTVLGTLWMDRVTKLVTKGELDLARLAVGGSKLRGDNIVGVLPENTTSGLAPSFPQTVGATAGWLRSKVLELHS